MRETKKSHKPVYAPVKSLHFSQLIQFYILSSSNAPE